MMDNILISIIIPVYKVEKLLPRCIESVISQTYTNLEIILVDDGSPDNSGVICDEYSAKDTRIKVVHKGNGGLPSARNAGLDIATGDYIGFIDSDDYIENNMYENLIRQVKKYDSDIACCGIKRIFDDGRRIEKTSRYAKDVCFDREQAFVEFQLYDGIGPAAWNKIFRSNIVKNIRFQPYKRLEDFWYVGKCISNSNTVSYSPVYGYNYMIRKNSITHSDFSDKDYDIIKVTNEIYKLFKEQYPDNPMCEITKILWNIVCINEMIMSGIYNKIVIDKCKSSIAYNIENIYKTSYLTWSRKCQMFFFFIGYTPYKIFYKLYMKLTGK